MEADQAPEVHNLVLRTFSPWAGFMCLLAVSLSHLIGGGHHH